RSVRGAVFSHTTRSARRRPAGLRSHLSICITRYTDYSVRVLIYLGVKNDGALAPIQEIADSYGISKNHLMKVVHDLQQRGYIDTIRGKHGGLRLRLPPEQINIGRVIRETEEDKALVECFKIGRAHV